MQSIRFTPETLSNEAMRFTSKISAGMETLKSLDDVHFGVTDKEAVYAEDKLVLYHYQGAKKPTAKIPTLIVYALVNRPYMVDLQEDRSLVRNLLAQGEDLYLIDWGYPDRADRFTSLDDYINGYIRRCVDAICRRHGLSKINILGICQGGAFSLCYASIYPETVQNLITMVTPVDFHTADNMLSRWTRSMDVDAFVDANGNVSADMMNFCYLTLKPFRLFHQKYVGLAEILDDKAELENFLRMEKWIFDSPDQAGEAFRQFVKDFYQANKLVEGGLTDKSVDLANVTMPVLNIYAEQDHLVPPSASKPMEKLVGTKDYSVLAFRGGHIGIYVSGRAQREVPTAIHQWLAKRAK